ncbi:MAG: type II toxin-antitoxin system VapC family toxin [Actinobacteria bacterium]|nr:type II toxin-antitoxin system VapC family toxin [Actinomycetota bacterium]
MGQKSHADTSWLIALFDNEDEHHKKALREFEELTTAPSISALAFAELLVGFENSDLPTSPDELRRSLPQIIAIDAEIATLAAKIRASNKIALADAIIIATALNEKTALLTFDKSMKVVYERIK